MKAKLLITSGKLLVTSGTAACLGIMAALMPADVQAAQVNATLSWVTGIMVQLTITAVHVWI